MKLPEGFSELGILRADKDDDGNLFYSKYWYFGEVDSK
ncbi:hypothetical protein O185_07985 [Photorhabdus temperata J3]|uniref:PLAT domain-containing protein n=1 Tax=Photorhabdus temperata J3 TaxID=1389415 RepID=U7R0U2_PHOTE|nr:hypothetical protein O185_07985 [Photorhabdus temperata J3]